MEYNHKSVLLYETVDSLNVKEGNTYVDATFGGGGHSGYLLSKADNINLYVFDQDEEAIKNGMNNFAGNNNKGFLLEGTTERAVRRWFPPYQNL